MRHALMGAIGSMALLFTASAVAVDLSRVLPSFELPAAPRLRAEAPSPGAPDAPGPSAPAITDDTVAGAGHTAPAPAGPPATSAAVPAGQTTQTAPTRRERGWREMLPGLLHQP